MAANEITKIIVFVVSYNDILISINIDYWISMLISKGGNSGRSRVLSGPLESLTTIHIILDTFHNYVNAKTSFPEATLVLKICAY